MNKLHGVLSAICTVVFPTCLDAGAKQPNLFAGVIAVTVVLSFIMGIGMLLLACVSWAGYAMHTTPGAIQRAVNVYHSWADRNTPKLP